MKRSLKPYWLNFVFLLTVVAVSAIWLKGATEETPETTTRSIEGRYHWADLERDVLIEIKNGEYTETQQSGESAIREATSSGYCFLSEGRILLSERETDKARTFETTAIGIRELGAQTETPREFERCIHASALIERGENPYSVDGVQLGMSKLEVEARWGELSRAWCGWNAYDAQNGGLVTFDPSGRVIFVSGSILYEFSRPLSDQELSTFGHPNPLHPDFGLSLYDDRIAGDYQVAIFNPDQREAREETYLTVSYDPFELDRMPEGRSSVSLGYRR